MSLLIQILFLISLSSINSCGEDNDSFTAGPFQEYIVDSTGNTLGQTFSDSGFRGDNYYWFPILLDTGEVYAINLQNGYVFPAAATSSGYTCYYTEADCSGQCYISSRSSSDEKVSSTIFLYDYGTKRPVSTDSSQENTTDAVTVAAKVDGDSCYSLNFPGQLGSSYYVAQAVSIETLASPSLPLSITVR